MYDYGFRIYDPRLGKFLSIDPLAFYFPYWTPYQFAGNTPIYAVDLDGLETLPYSYYNGDFYTGVAKTVANSKAVKGTLNMTFGVVMTAGGVALCAVPGLQPVGVLAIVGGTGQIGLGAAQLIAALDDNEQVREKVFSYDNYGHLVGSAVEGAGVPGAGDVGKHAYNILAIATSGLKSFSAISESAGFLNIINRLNAYAIAPLRLTLELNKVKDELIEKYVPKDVQTNATKVNSTITEVRDEVGTIIGVNFTYQAFDKEGKEIANYTINTQAVSTEELKEQKRNEEAKTNHPNFISE